MSILAALFTLFALAGMSACFAAGSLKNEIEKINETQP